MKFTNVDITKNELVIKKQLAEHELFLSFGDDAGAENFCEWWFKIGSKYFADWMLAHDFDESWIR